MVKGQVGDTYQVEALQILDHDGAGRILVQIGADKDDLAFAVGNTIGSRALGFYLRILAIPPV